MASIYGNYDTRKAWMRYRNSDALTAHNGIIVDCRVDDLYNIQSITYQNGNSVRKAIETCVGKWRRAIVWYGNAVWNVTDYSTGIVLCTYGNREDALAYVAYDEARFYENTKVFAEYGNYVESRRWEMWNLRLYLSDARKYGKRVSDKRIPLARLNAWVASPNANQFCKH